MKRLFPLTIIVLSLLASCYSVEDAADVNQERIQTFYYTEYNATRGTTKAQLSFRFGQTPLKMSNSLYYEDAKLKEKEDLIFGLHYSRKIDGISSGQYEWTDETGDIYSNLVPIYAFDLLEPVETLQKYTYYKLDWFGSEIPNDSEGFSISIESHVNGYVRSFNSEDLIEIHSDHLTDMPSGKARLTISRNYSETIDEKTLAGGDSKVTVIREFEIAIIE